MSLLSFVFPAPALLSPAAFVPSYTHRRRVLPLTPGRRRPEPMPLPSCHPEIPPPVPLIDAVFQLLLELGLAPLPVCWLR